MKDIVRIAAIAAAAAVTAVFVRGTADTVQSKPEAGSTETAAVPEGTEDGEPIYLSMGSPAFYIYGEESGTVAELSQEEYVIGAVMAEMPADYPEEALMAQAAAVNTYAVRRREEELISPDEKLCGGYISEDPEKYRTALTEEQARELYGGNYEEAYERIAAAVKRVSDRVILYNGEPAAAPYHAVSAGKTESAENALGTAVDFLIPVDSSFDSTSPDYLTESRFTSAEVYGRLSAEYPDIPFPESAAEELYISEKTQSDTVMRLCCGNSEIKGSDFRRIFSLPSSAFELDYSEGYLTVTSRGRGNGVGMSCYGAKCLAEQGYTYDEILKYYYTGVEIARLEFVNS